MLLVASAQAETCGRVLMGSLDLLTTPEGGLAVQGDLGDGVAREFRVNLSAGGTAIRDSIVTRYGWKRLGRPAGAHAFYHGQRVTAFVRIPKLHLGHTVISDVRASVLPESDPPNTTDVTAGSLGDDVLSNFDIELDFAAKKMNLFSQHHCPGQAAYWAPSAEAVPLSYVYGSFRAQVTIDGKPFDMFFDTSSAESRIDLRLAHDAFGIDRSSPGITPVSGIHANRGRERDYTAAFKRLMLGNLVIDNPDIKLVDVSDVARHNYSRETNIRGLEEAIRGDDILTPLFMPRAMPFATIGVRDMSHFRIYIAFEDKSMFLTLAAKPNATVTVSGEKPEPN